MTAMAQEATGARRRGRPYDQAARRKLTRQRPTERGLHLYIPAEVLEGLGFREGEDVWARMWPDANRPRIIVNLYREA